MLARSRRCAPGRSGPARSSPGYPAPDARSCLPALGAARRAAQAPLAPRRDTRLPTLAHAPYLIVRSLKVGLTVGVAVVRTTWYWMYRDRTLMEEPELPSVVYALHVVLGVALFPVRTRTTAEVPAGAPAVHDALSQRTDDPPSSTREVNVPVGAYGVSRNQFTSTAAPPGVLSRTTARMLVGIETFCVATTTPSTEYTTDAKLQTMR